MSIKIVILRGVEPASARRASERIDAAPSAANATTTASLGAEVGAEAPSRSHLRSNWRRLSCSYSQIESLNLNLERAKRAASKRDLFQMAGQIWSKAKSLHHESRACRLPSSSRRPILGKSSSAGRLMGSDCFSISRQPELKPSGGRHLCRRASEPLHLIFAR